MATTGEIIRALRRERGLLQEDMIKATGISRRRWILIEQDKSELKWQEVQTIAALLGVSVAELNDETTRQDLSRKWYAAWETSRKEVNVVDRHSIQAHQTLDRLTLVADGNYRWHADCQLVGDSLLGQYRSAEKGKPYWGVLHLRVRESLLVGHWSGKNVDGSPRSGRGVLARDENVAGEYMALWLQRGTLPIWPQ